MANDAAQDKYPNVSPRTAGSDKKDCDVEAAVILLVMA
jgi:hypothetical protein